LCLIAGGIVLLYVVTAGGGYPLDDSWIHQTYARNLATTGQWAFVPGEPSAASTSPLYTLLLALGYAIGLPASVWTHALGALALALTGMIGRRIAWQLAPDTAYAPLLAGLAIVLSWHLIWAAASGMETMLFSLWALVLAWLGLRYAMNPPGLIVGGMVFGVVSALMVITRPEGVIFAAFAATGPLIAAWQRGMRVAAGWAVMALLAFLIGIAPYLWLNLHLTGGLLPDTAAAKQAEYAPLLARPYVERVVEMLLPLSAGAQLLLLPGVFMFVLNRLKVGAMPSRIAGLAPLAASLALVLLYAARLPVAYQHGRYVMPALPYVLICGVIGTIWLVGRTRRSLIARVAGRTLATSIVLVLFLFAVVVGRDAYRRDVQIINEEMVTAAHWIAANIPPDDLLAVHDIGAVGYFAPRPILDLAGLVSPEVVPLMGQPEALWSLMEARGAAYLMAFTDQIPGRSPDDGRLCPVFVTGGQTAPTFGQSNMTVYALDWSGRRCSGEMMETG